MAAHMASIALSEPGIPAALAAEPQSSSAARAIAKKFLRALIVVILIRSFVGEASLVPTGSMENTILVGDHLFWDKALYGPEVPLLHWRLPVLKKVHRGDVIAFRFP